MLIHRSRFPVNIERFLSDNFDLKAEGALSIDLVFKSPLAAVINVLAYAEYDNVIEIDSNRKVIKDWSN